MDLSESFQDLVHKAQRGDRQAMELLLEALRPHIRQIAAGYADPACAEESTSDLVQEAGLKIWQRLEQFKGGASDQETEAMLRGWVGQIVHRLAINAHRDRQAQKRRPEGGAIVSLAGKSGDSTGFQAGLDPQASGPGASSILRSEEESQRVREAIEKIPDRTNRMIVYMRFFDGLTLREIAGRLSLSYDAVRDRFQASLRQLERQIGSLE